MLAKSYYMTDWDSDHCALLAMSYYMTYWASDHCALLAMPYYMKYWGSDHCALCHSTQHNHISLTIKYVLDHFSV